jgi:hypothetical protein
MWIAVLALGLIGIVTIQVVILQLNTSIGRSLSRAAGQQRENAALAIADSEAGSGEKIEAQAARLGMHAVPPGELRFMRAAGRGAAAAAARALRSTTASSATSLTSTLGGSSPSGFVTAANGETALTQPTQESPQPAAGSRQAQEAAASAAVPGPESQAASTGQAEAPAAASGQSALTTPAAGQETQSGVQAGAAQAPSGAGG